MTYTSQNWARRLENVLSDRSALDAFREWLEPRYGAQALDLHFALIAFGKVETEQREALALLIYERFISPRTGCCDFLPKAFRSEVTRRIRGSSAIANDAFSPIFQPLDGYLRRLHEEFVSSDEFLELFNQYSLSADHHDFERRRRKSEQTPTTRPLTAAMLLKSRHDRENALGESVVEKMFSNNRHPYTSRPTTSQQDSAVSSAFSSEATASLRGNRLRAIREEHVRHNPPAFTVPRVEQWRHADSSQLDHSTEEGRKQFATILTKKLKRELERQKRNDDTEKQLFDLEAKRLTARDLISSTIDDGVDADDDDDLLDRYMNRMPADESVRASAHRSPRMPGYPMSPGSPERQKVWTTSYPAPNQRSSFATAPIAAFASPYKERSFSSSSAHHHRTNTACDSSGISSGYSGDSRGMARSWRRRSSTTTKPTSLITISYKGPDGVPVVAHVPYNGRMTFREFRKHFLIKSNGAYQFFFKSCSNDEDAPYELQLITDDDAILPVFQDKISADMKSSSPL